MIPHLASQRWVRPKPFKCPKGSKDAPVTIPEDAITSFGLTALFIQWIKDQRAAEKKLHQNTLSLEDQEYISNPKRYGCAFPPCLEYRPALEDLSGLKGITIRPTKQDSDIIQSCLDIASSSTFSWAQQKSNLAQTAPGVAMDFLALYHNKKPIYQAYLGQDTIWDAYSKMAVILEEISHFWVPWHSINANSRVSSEHQWIQKTRDGKEVNAIVGVAVAQSAADVDMKYRKGIALIWKTIQDLCGVAVKPDHDSDSDSDDVQEGSSTMLKKIPRNVLKSTLDLFHVRVF
jgi:hypothetical protein